MYQAIYYDYQSSTCFLRDDNEGWQQFQYRKTFYKQDLNGKFLTLDGKKVTPVLRADKDDLSIYEKDVDINLRVLLDIYKDYDEAPSFHNILFFDIETVMGGAINLPYCQEAPSAITSVAIYDKQLDEYSVYVLDFDSAMKQSTKKNTTIYPCKHEVDLLMKVIDKWKSIDPTLVITWNGDNFDIPYMYNRMKRLLGESKANELSPIGIVYFDEYDKEKMPYKIAGLTSLDYMRLYKKFIPKQQPSYALDSICKKDIGRGKITYTGKLDQLFKDDPEKFIEYNVNDVSLIVDLDKKRKFIDLAVMVAHMAHVPYHYVYQSSRVVEGAIMTYLKRKDIVSPNKPTTMHPELKKEFKSDNEEDEKFAGAYVKTPVPGLYGWNGDEDLESLYPSEGIQLNLGIDTFLFKIQIDDPFDDTWNLKDLKNKEQERYVTLKDLNDNKTDIQIGKLIEMIEEGNIIISPNGVAFDSGETSILSEVMDYWFLKRKEFKQLMIKNGKSGNKELYALYDLYQQVMKVFLNSIYGSLALVGFRYSDGKDYLASAITAAGRLTIMKSADWVNEWIHDRYEPNSPVINDYVIMSDTDSLYIDSKAIIKYFNLEDAEEQLIVNKLREVFKQISDEMNIYYKTFTKERFNSDNNRLKIKSETIGKKLYVSAKKQYAQYIVDKEGVKMEGEDRFDFKGLDFMKASYPPLFKTFTQNIIKDILLDQPKSKIDSDILDFREQYKTLPLHDAAKPTGVNGMSDYIKMRPRSSQMFSTMEKGAPVHTKAAVFYNDLLKFKDLQKKYSIIQVGDKIKWMYLTNNPYKLDALAFPVYDYSPEIMEMIEKYMDRERMFNALLLNKLEKIYTNLSWGDINFNRNTKKFWKFAK